jgi:glycerol-3-phosphate dehydrogenase (NAD(P)+)
MNKTIALLGAGSWGTAIAIQLAQLGQPVLLWGHDPQHVARMNKERANHRYLPKVPFPKNLSAVADLNHCLRHAHVVIIAVPSHAFADVLQQMTTAPQGLAWLTKGIDPESKHLLHELVAQRFGPTLPTAMISGPSFAQEVAHHLPTALTLASTNSSYQNELHQLIHHHHIRAYLTDDLIGVQLCGAVKNILAIACGLSDGLGYGANARAALITRGLAEMSRLGLRYGARQETFLGLAGVGDLVLTCTDNQSRNRRFGLLLGQGVASDKAEEQIGQVVEGKHNAAQIGALAQRQGVEMPICEQINALLNQQITPTQVVHHLMSRPAREE